MAMIYPDGPPPDAFETWATAAQRACPLIGILIITWQNCESIMNTTAIGVRTAPGTDYAQWPRLSHKFKQRLNEWIRLCLIPSKHPADPEKLRSDLLRLQTVRNNVAHNISAMWVDTTNELRVFCTFDNKDYEKQAAAFDYSQGSEGAPLPLTAITYSGDALVDIHNEMRRYLRLVADVQVTISPYLKS